MNKANISIKLLISLIIISISGFVLAASKSDLAKEKRWREQIEPSLMVGDAVSLEAGKTKFLALFSENSADKTHGGVILLHGIGVHPAWPDVIEPLRTELPEYGWHTLSLQMPILKNDAKAEQYAPLFDEVPARIQAAVDFYTSKGVKNIVIIAHSLGTVMSGYYLTTKKQHKVKAFVAVSLTQGVPADSKMNNYANLGKIKIPILDIFGSEDFPQSVSSAAKRPVIARKAGNKRYQQVKIEGANHFFSGMDDVLVKRVRSWLTKTVVGR